MPRAGACEQTQNCTEISWLPQAEEIGLYRPEPLLLSTQCFYGYTFPSFLTHAFSYTPALPRAVCLSAPPARVRAHDQDTSTPNTAPALPPAHSLKTQYPAEEGPTRTHFTAQGPHRQPPEPPTLFII